MLNSFAYLTVSLGCGTSSSENNTFFLSNSATTSSPGQCGMTICKCSSDICQVRKVIETFYKETLLAKFCQFQQLRLDFSTFVISGPNTFTQSTVAVVNGAFTQGGISSDSLATQCLTDTFSVTGVGSHPPVICGTNSGYHSGF